MPFGVVLLPLASLIAALVRWWLQGSGNLYTALDKRFFVPDPDLKWRISDEHPIWIGLEVCGILLAWTIAIVVGIWWQRRRAKRVGKTRILVPAIWTAAALSLVVPIGAFATGGRPTGAVDIRPVAEATKIDGGIAGKLELPAGRYEVVAPHQGTAIIARVSAGGEAFDARFAGDIRGGWQGDPSDLTKPMTAEISVATASVDTGIDQRSGHARDSYLLASKYPRITFSLDKVLAARNDAPDKVAFKAAGTVGLVGKTHRIEVTGTLEKPNAAALERMRLTGTILRVDADLSIVIAESAFAADKSDFDGDRIPIHVSLVLRHTGG